VPELRRHERLLVEGGERGRTRFLAFILLSVLVLAILTEGGSRLFLFLRDRPASSRPPAGAAVRAAIDVEAAGKSLGLDSYEIADARYPFHWRPRPGCMLTLGDVIENKKKEGRVLAVRYLEERAPVLGIHPQDIAIRINRDGFRGPEIDPSHSRFRILALGDSCTFGTALSHALGYPCVLESELRRAGFEAEVINAGVEGYAPRNVLLRIDEFKALGPELTTIYIGWNAIYEETFLRDAFGARKHIYSARLAGRAYDRAQRLFGDTRQRALDAYNRPKRPDRNAPEVLVLDGYTPSFLPEVERIVGEMEAAGSRVVLITLPGLYNMDEEPTARALQAGHLPAFTDNPYVLARMAERYNDALRAIGRKRGLQVIDLDAWSREALRPRDAHFFDAVHLHEKSQEMIGIHLAHELLPRLREAGRRSSLPPGTL
jgi:lysophospholipase L1-like esterase